MKKIVLMALACLFTVGVYAQQPKENENQGYLRVTASYAGTTFGYKNEAVETKNLNGVEIGITRGLSLSKKMPLYFELGLGARYSFASDSETIYDEITETESVTDYKYSLWTINVPVNVTYKFDAGKGITVAPYAGLHFAFNVAGTVKVTEGDVTEDLNYFSPKDMGSNKLTPDHIQIGGQIGVGAEWKKMYLGVGYSLDFSKYREDVTSKGIRVTLGYTF